MGLLRPIRCIREPVRTTLTQIRPIDGSGHLVLRQTGELTELVAGNVVLLSSAALATEFAFGALAATLAPQPQGGSTKPTHVVIGGLGFGATLRGVLDVVPANSRVTVVEKVRAIPRLVGGPLAHIARKPLEDPRVELVEGDVGQVVSTMDASVGLVLLDVDNGPHWASFRSNARLYSPAGLAEFRRSLSPGGALAVWSGYRADAFTHRLREAGFAASIIPLTERGRTRARAYVGRLV